MKCSQLVPTLAGLSGSHDVSVFTNMLLCGVVRSHCDVIISSHGNQIPSSDVIVGVVKDVPMSEAIVVQFTRSGTSVNMFNDLVIQYSTQRYVLKC